MEKALISPNNKKYANNNDNISLIGFRYQQPFALLHHFIVVQKCACPESLSLKGPSPLVDLHMSISAGRFLQALSTPLRSVPSARTPLMKRAWLVPRKY